MHTLWWLTWWPTEIKVDMVVNKEVDKVADMEVDMVADMEVYMPYILYGR